MCVRVQARAIDTSTHNCVLPRIRGLMHSHSPGIFLFTADYRHRRLCHSVAADDERQRRRQRRRWGARRRNRAFEKNTYIPHLIISYIFPVRILSITAQIITVCCHSSDRELCNFSSFLPVCGFARPKLVQILRCGGVPYLRLNCAQHAEKNALNSTKRTIFVHCV